MSPIHLEARNTLALYLAKFPEESLRLTLLREQLDTSEDIFARSNMRGHVTTSAVVLNTECTKVLLIDHLALKKRLPPGGHYEGPGTLWDSARREVEEETNVYGAQLHGWSAWHRVPLDIDSHAIPANPAKGEGDHVHHDFTFLAIAPEQELHAQLAEVASAMWVPARALLDSPESRVRALFIKMARLNVFGAVG
jgi:8-oxo-dGTP pyrophosphatase MutT (NUDIX family)